MSVDERLDQVTAYTECCRDNTKSHEYSDAPSVSCQLSLPTGQGPNASSPRWRQHECLAPNLTSGRFASLLLSFGTRRLHDLHLPDNRPSTRTRIPVIDTHFDPHCIILTEAKMLNEG